jgi:hypothetical protein
MVYLFLRQLDENNIFGGQNNDFEISAPYHCSGSSENDFCSVCKFCFSEQWNLQAQQ